MSSNIPIPDVVVPRLREGAKAVMRSLGCELEDTADDPGAFGKLHDQLRGMWGLLDVIGWSDGGIEALLMGMRHPDQVTKIAAMAANIFPEGQAPETEAAK